MAKVAKKKAELTSEEKLAQALVPEAEQPYKVPENWCWSKISQVYEVNPKNTADNEIDSAFVPMEKISAGTEYGFQYEVQKWGQARKGHTQFADGDVAFAKISPCFENGKSMIVNGLPNRIGGGTTELVVLRQPWMDQHYTYWLISTDHFIRGGCQTYSGTVGQQRISMDYIKNYPIPIPPLPEQQRIVDRIESLFAKLDEAKEKAQAVVDGFEDRKAAILHKAFTGELTAEWRKRNGIPSATWKEVSLDSVCNSIYDGDHMPPPKSDEGIPFLVISNVNTGYLSYTGTRFVPQEYYDGLTETRKPERGDVLYTLVGSYGIPVVIDDDRPFCFQRHMALMKPSLINTYFLWFQLQSKEFYNKATEIATGTAQLTVPIKGLRKLTVHLPSETEQIEVVRILDKLIGGEQQAKEAAEQVIDQIDIMKKSILARAFRGELGTNDPAEESAIELLKRML